MRRALRVLGFVAAVAAVGTAIAADAPEISRSRGVSGGVVVLWPRVVPRTDDPTFAAIATDVQQRLAGAAAVAFPGAPVDVRPAPERVCPQGGCDATALGAVLAHSESGCVVVVTVAAPGPSPNRLVPWVGSVGITGTTAFRDPPEAAIKVYDYADCAQVGTLADQGSAMVQAMLQAP